MTTAGRVLHSVYNQKSFIKQLGLGEDGETGKDNDIPDEVINRTRAPTMGKRLSETSLLLR